MPEAAALPANEAERLASLRSYDVLDSPAEPGFDRIVALASEICEAPIALVSLVDAHRQWFKAACGLDVSETSRDLAFCAHAIHRDEVMVVRDAASDPRFHDSPLVVGPPHIRSYAGAPLITGDGLRLGTLCVIHDEVAHLTSRQLSQLQKLAAMVVDELELRRSFMELARARAEAERSNQAKSQFLSYMSHEIRTPLTGVIGMADLLLTAGLGALERQRAQTIRSSALDLLAILNDILDYAKLESGKVSLEPADFALADLLEEVESLMAGLAGDKGLGLRHGLAPGLPAQVRQDRGRLRQILLNLAQNAIKFTETGEVAIRVAPDQHRPGDFNLRFEVRDSGIGIARDDQPQLFQPFQQVNSSTNRSQGGTGLGLAICRELLQAMGGEIGVESEPGVGSTFWFTLPCEAPRAASPATAPQPGHGIAASRALSVLVAEDNATNQMILQAYLERLGHAVVLTADGEEAVEAAERGAFDLVLMDMRMPRVDGIEATRRIRALPGDQGRVPILGVSADLVESHREACLRAGMNGITGKPIVEAALFQAIDEAIGAPIHRPARVA